MLARRRRVLSARLHDRRRGGDAELTRGADVVLTPEDDPGRHRVLGEVGVGPFVDVVGQAVAPVLEELGGRPGVVDLVEVHLIWLGEAERPERHRGDDEDDQEPQVKAVEPASTFGDERRAAVRADRSVAEPGPEPADDAELGECPPLASRSASAPAAARPSSCGGRRDGRARNGDRTSAGAGPLNDRRPALARTGGCRADRGRTGRGAAPRESARDRRRAPATAGRQRRAGTDAPAVRRRSTALRQLATPPPPRPRAASARLARSCRNAHPNPARCSRAIRITPGSERMDGTDPQPVLDRRVVRVERRQDDVHVQERRHRQERIGDRPAPREDREDHDRARRTGIRSARGRESGRRRRRGSGPRDRRAGSADRGGARRGTSVTTIAARSRAVPTRTAGTAPKTAEPAPHWSAEPAKSQTHCPAFARL